MKEVDAAILRALRDEDTIEGLAKRLGYTTQYISTRLQELQANGLVRITGRRPSPGRGRWPHTWGIAEGADNQWQFQGPGAGYHRIR